MTDYYSIVKKNAPPDARWFDVIETSGEGFSLSYKNNRAHSVNRREGSGAGVRLNISGKTGFAYTNNPDKFTTAAASAAATSKFGETEDFTLPSRAEKKFEPCDPASESFDIKTCSDEAEEAIAAIRSAHPDAVVDVSISAGYGTTRIVNSEGLDLSYKNSIFSASVSATKIFDDGSKIDVYEGVSFLSHKPFLFLAERVIEKISLGSSNTPCPSGSVPVLFTPSAFARLISLVCSGMNGRAVYKGISPFAGKIGEKLFSENLSVLNSPSMQGSPFSFPFDDEGVTARDYFIIKGGIISEYALDLKHSSLLGLPSTAGGSRGYSSLPLPSFSSIVITEGADSLASLISGIKKGVLADQFIGFGQSNTITGDFSANLDLAYSIENGVVTGRVKNSMITDNIFNLLKGDFNLSRERETRGGSLIPYAFFPKVNILC